MAEATVRFQRTPAARPTPEELDLYAARRARVLERLGEDGVLVIPAAPEVRAGRDLELRYRPDPDLYYLTGYVEPEAVLVLAPGHADGAFTLFVRPRDPERERWTGVRGGPEAARDLYRADAAYPLSELEQRLPALLRARETVYCALDSGADGVDAIVREALRHGRATRQRSGRGPRFLADPGVLLDELRIRKDPRELELLRDAARITVEAFLDAAPLIAPGAGEWEVEAALEAAFRRRGADGPGFGTIVASGANATVLHYIANDRRMAAGDLLLIDAGARYCGYNADISRTFPVSGRFSPPQRELYDAVLEAHGRALDAVRPGATTAHVHQAALRALVEAMVAFGLLDGDVDGLIEQEKYRPFYPHQTSHWLGLDVHDVGDYAVRGEPRALEPGMVLTIEPGLYVPADAEAAPAELRGVGIRIEDDVAVTEDGREVLTAAMPAAAERIEALPRRNG
ncbi:MAG TPA: aminopeptidase P N-terminal domain-containing protein [Longimicrobiales bacterium]